MPLSRRDFLKLSAAAGVAAGATVSTPWDAWGQLPLSLAAEAASGLTTVQRTIVKGAKLRDGTQGSYYRLTYGPGEPHIVRHDLHKKHTRAAIDRAWSFVHFTDVHLVDTQSPARVEFLDRYADQQCDSAPLDAAQRPHETLTTHVFEAMIRRIRAIGRGPRTGRPFKFAMCTGDNVDNEQYNELRWFIDLMDGGATVTPNSGGPTYEGVQAADWGDPEYWHPDTVADKYKDGYGYPDYPGLLELAIVGFQATGLGLPWWQTFGNHDGLLQGNAPRTEAFAQIATGPAKFSGPPPGMDPCNPFPSVPLAPTKPVTADANRRIVRRGEYIEEHFTTRGTPSGHGFHKRNRADGTAYYSRDDFKPFRFIALDTVNPGGYADGSIGQAQFDWLEQKLIQVHGRYFDGSGNVVKTKHHDRLVILFSHHGLRSLNNPVQDENSDDPGANDLPRKMAADVEALVHRFPTVIAWVNGHTHNNQVDPRPDPAGRTPGFWDIGTAAHVDWICQSRIVEVALRRDGVLSIFGTVVDHAAPPDPAHASGVLRLASINRELCANDFQFGFDSKGPGRPEDRNVELLLPAPAWLVKTLR
jgi:metallophosphoesterase (TIGR03767 family)